jgi:hypothetical protein
MQSLHMAGDPNAFKAQVDTVSHVSVDLQSVLRFDCTIEVLEHDGSRPYVSLSYVWSDALGNMRGNSAPTCRIPLL